MRLKQDVTMTIEPALTLIEKNNFWSSELRFQHHSVIQKNSCASYSTLKLSGFFPLCITTKIIDQLLKPNYLKTNPCVNMPMIFSKAKHHWADPHICSHVKTHTEIHRICIVVEGQRAVKWFTQRKLRISLVTCQFPPPVTLSII